MSSKQIQIRGTERLSTERLNALPTHRLLALYRARRQWKDRWYVSEGSDPVEENEWIKLDEYVDEMKRILDTREHVER